MDHQLVMVLTWFSHLQYVATKCIQYLRPFYRALISKKESADC